jgi:putative Holliday junction resolvase
MTGSRRSVCQADGVVRPGVRLGVDVGSVRVGLAASDPTGLVATPVATVPRDSSDARTDVARIAASVRDLDAVEVVVGLPLLLSGEEGEAALLARAYALELALAVAPVPVRLVDERLTTVDAHRRLRESGVAGRSQRDVVDQTAAVLILQSALDGERVSGRAPGRRVGPQRRRPRTKDRG